MTSRRSFLKLGGIAAAVTIVGLPALAEAVPAVAAVGMGPVSLNELNELTKIRILPGIADQFFKQGPLLTMLKKGKSRYVPTAELLP